MNNRKPYIYVTVPKPTVTVLHVSPERHGEKWTDRSGVTETKKEGRGSESEWKKKQKQRKRKRQIVRQTVWKDHFPH